MPTIEAAISNIGPTIKSKREALDLSLQDLADRTWVTKTHVWELEQGRSSSPKIQTCLRLCDALNISLNELLGFDTSKSRITDEEMMLITEHRRIFGADKKE